jgi:antitoxin (DNA-binding transcriptional repressor) of toxin-antitoxin stability system
MNTFTIYNAKSQFSKLLSRVELGEEIIISNRGSASKAATQIFKSRHNRNITILTW